MASSQAKLKIGFVFDDSLDRNDGVQQYVRTLGEWLRENGHEVKYLVGETSIQNPLNDHIHSLARNVAVKANKNRLTIPLPANKKHIRDVMAKEQFDVLHVQVPYSPLLAGRVITAAPPETTIVGTFHIVGETMFEKFGSRLLSFFQRRSLNKFDALYSVSAAAKEFCQTYYNRTTKILPNVVDVSAFATASQKREQDDMFRIVFLGRLVERKGAGLLIEAASQLSDKQDLDIRIAGNGPLRKKLEQQVHNKHLNSIVHFDGYIEEDKKADFLASADLAVFPANGGESFGIVLLEAMAVDAPVVLGGNNVGYKTVLGQAPELLFHALDADDLAQRIEWARQLSATSRQSVLKKQREIIDSFDVNHIGPKVVKAYLDTKK